MNIDYFNKIVTIIFILCYTYQALYLFLPLFVKNKARVINDKTNRYAILIAARNEEQVIGNLIDSLKNQNYPSDYVDIYVCADNCSDNTYELAKQKGAIVYKRFNSVEVGKGYVLNCLLNKIKQTNKHYDAYLVFDADNIVDKDFIKEINRVYNEGYQAVTSYRNSKNYGDNWISAGYGLWYLHESSHLNTSRMIINSSCAISGTGFLVSNELIENNDGWNYFLLTEDIEFSVDSVLKDIKIGYADKAVVYDEQPTSFKQSFNQRLRWSKGIIQVLNKYGLELIKKVIKGDFSSYDMLMNSAPAGIISFISFIVNITYILDCFLLNNSFIYLFSSLFNVFLGMYLILFIISLLTTLKEWKNIYCANLKKIIYIFTCPIFMLTYMPITIVALFKKVEWTPIAHTRRLNLNQIRR